MSSIVEVDGILTEQPLKKILWLSNDKVRFISLKVNGGVAYEGIRFYDNKKDKIVDEEWSNSTQGKWTEI